MLRAKHESSAGRANGRTDCPAFDFMDIGQPPLRSKRKRKTDGLEFDQEAIDAAFIEKATAFVAELSFDLGMVLVQLRHWYEKVGRQGPGARG